MIEKKSFGYIITLVKVFFKKGGVPTITLQEQVVRKIQFLSDDNLKFLLEMINRFMQPDIAQEKTVVHTKRIGIAKGQDLYDDDYDPSLPLAKPNQIKNFLFLQGFPCFFYSIML